MNARVLPWHRISTRLAKRGRAWALKRQGSDRQSAELHGKRIYILPTRTGFLYGAVVLVLLLGSMNYSNNMGFALTFLLAGMGLVSMHHCQRNLSGLRITLIGSEPGFAGEHVSFRLRMENSGGPARWQIFAGWDRHSGQPADLAPGASTTISLPVIAPRRGRLQIPRVAISSDFPLGLVRAWSWVHMDGCTTVWPNPVAHAERPPSSGTDAGGHSVIEGGDELSGVRDYQPGDSPRRIDWKALARYGELRVREFRDGSSDQCWLDWDALEHADTEQRLAILARLVLDATADGQSFGLRLPDATIPPGNGESHLNDCLNKLALVGSPAPYCPAESE